MPEAFSPPNKQISENQPKRCSEKQTAFRKFANYTIESVR